ncbi:MAG: hydrogenase 4 subunit B [Rhodospirillaceae bacterium]|nr:hydrogenase 4 subunit B [Rhodospirillaceae bacterium]
MTVVLGLILVLLACGAAGIAAARRPGGHVWIYGACLGATAALLVTGLVFLVAVVDGVRSWSAVLPLGIPWLGAHVRLDPLSAFFLVVVDLGAGAASLFGLGTGRHEEEPRRVLPFFPVFLAGMNLVLVADDAFTFLLSWEFMSLSSWALVMAHHRAPGNARAGYVYIVMAGFGTLSLLLAFGLLAGPEGGYAFDTIRLGTQTRLTALLVLVLTLLGAGSKAGIVPLHAWLPLAHPAAPSHVSALMSGVMTKVAVYALVRVVFDLLDDPQWWWGAVILVVGGLTAVMGVLYALMQHDLKRLLAYHTVENIGIIYIGLGLAVAFHANGMAAAAALALTAALFHVFNHATFKSLLFLGAGAVLGATGERDMEKLGGLIHRMPVTAFLVLVGCAAISALPPLNGFVSEWLTLQAILISPDLPQWLLKFLVPAVGAALALSAALAATCFVKAFGITFLGRPRSPAVATAAETDRLSLAAMGVLAALCLAAGVLPGIAVELLAPVVGRLTGGAVAMAEWGWVRLAPVSAERSSYSGLLLFALIAAVAALTAWVVHRAASRAARRGPAWGCGFPWQTAEMQYTAASFAQPIRRVFGPIFFHAAESVDMPAPGELRPASLTVRLRDLAWDWLYAPVAVGVGFAADRLNRVQFLTIRRYLTLVFTALIVLLTVLSIWR